MTDKNWWKNAVVYQIYPRSFQDMDGDGIGDLRGIIERLDYLEKLGVDVIWLSPVYASPMVDNGYDISDYRAINPLFGTMEDFDELLSALHSRGMRLIMDLVVNHTSSEHPWFQEARKSRDNPYRGYYIWREGKDGEPPNNWISWFSGSTWEYNPPTGDYYLHIFAKEQPDLNWRNPKVREEIFDMMRWWLDKGVDGFRMDVISLISKPEELPDDPRGDLSPYCINGPHVHEYLREMNEKVLSKYDIMTVGECPGMTVEQAKIYAGFDSGELNMVFQFEHTGLTDGEFGKWTDKKTPLPALKRVFEKWQTGLFGESWNSLFWGNHDQPRAVTKFGDHSPEYSDLSAKMLCCCLYFMQGTPYIYQGDELGTPNPGFDELAHYRDIESINAYRDFVDSGILDEPTMLRYLARTGRDNARTPMQWAPNGGFTTGKPWISYGGSTRAVNAEMQLQDPDSVFCFYKKVLELRKSLPLVREGSFELLRPEHESLFVYIRRFEGQTLLVLCNFSAEWVTLPDNCRPASGTPVIANYPETARLEGALLPYECRVYIV